MKKIFIFIVMSILLAQTGFSEDIPIGKFSYKIYNDMWKNFTNAQGAVFLTEEHITLRFTGFIGSNTYYLTKSELEETRKAIEKYYNWSKIAQKNKETLEKKISTIKFLRAFFSYDGQEFFRATKPSSSITFTFFSQNFSRHQFLINFKKLTASNNEFIDHNLDTAYFDKDDIDKLYNMISDKTIKRKAEEAKQQKEKESKYQ